MKLNKYVIFAVLGLSVGVFSCTKDLDVTPIDPNSSTTQQVFSTTDGFKQALAKLYASYAVSGQVGPAGNADISGIDEGFGNYLRQYFNLQELSTDEAVMAWNDATIKDFHWQTWTATDVFNNALYSRIFYTIAVSNEYIRDANQYIGKLSATDQAIAQQYIAEARFVRALSYWHAIDLYGNPPFITENEKPGTFFPKQIKRSDLFAYIESELKGIETTLADPKTADYGHADKAAAWSLLARLYLNGEVYTGTAHWSDAITYCKKVLDANKYSINGIYGHNFNADNDQSPEIIFAINFDVSHTQTYGGTPFIIHAAIGGKMNPTDYGMGGGWGGLRTTSAFANKFANIDANGVSPDKRALFFTNGQSKEITDIGSFTDGWAVTKFTNLKNDGTRPAPFNDFVNTDFPVFRLADIYLMYAEAVTRGGTGGSQTAALGYVNELRTRAYGNTSGNVTSLDLPFILDERGRELYWEGIRRTDLIRFGQFTNGTYVWPWKGNVAAGTQVPAYRNLYPIPSQDLVNNPNLTQNPSY